MSTRHGTGETGKPGARRSSPGRAEVLRELTKEIPPEFFSPAEAAAIVFGRLELASRVARRVRLRLLVETMRIAAPDCHHRGAHAAAPARPMACLSRLNRSCVFPPLLLPTPRLPTVKLNDILQVVRRAHRQGTAWPRLLDLLCTSSGVSWRTAAILLAKITGGRLEDEAVIAVAQARQFWRVYTEGSERMAALQAAGELPLWYGMWAHFDRGEFGSLLPGVVLPDHYERHEYLTNYAQAGEDEAVDVYSVRGQPLFRHPFTREFQPLLASRSGVLAR